MYIQVSTIANIIVNLSRTFIKAIKTLVLCDINNNNIKLRLVMILTHSTYNWKHIHLHYVYI
jgi:hypothetical protein